MNKKVSNEIINDGEIIYINNPSDDLLKDINFNNFALYEDFED